MFNTSKLRYVATIFCGGNIPVGREGGIDGCA